MRKVLLIASLKIMLPVTSKGKVPRLLVFRSSDLNFFSHICIAKQCYAIAKFDHIVLYICSMVVVVYLYAGMGKVT
jgi:hypothetical protein